MSDTNRENITFTTAPDYSLRERSGATNKAYPHFLDLTPLPPSPSFWSEKRLSDFWHPAVKSAKIAGATHIVLMAAGLSAHAPPSPMPYHLAYLTTVAAGCFVMSRLCKQDTGDELSFSAAERQRQRTEKQDNIRGVFTGIALATGLSLAVQTLALPMIRNTVHGPAATESAQPAPPLPSPR